MLKKLLTAATLSLCAALAFAQEVSPAGKTPASEKKAENPKPAATSTVDKPPARPKPKPTPKPAAEAPVPELVATPAPKRRTFLERLFGMRKPPPATPTPTPAPTPSARKSSRKTATTPAPDQPVIAGTPKPVKSKPIKAAGTPKPGAADPKKTAVEADADSDVKERLRFDQAKAKAAEDPQVKSLKAKADDAATDEESRKALRTYNKALFEKIRQVDSSVAERATRLEAAILKRLTE